MLTIVEAQILMLLGPIFIWGGVNGIKAWSVVVKLIDAVRMFADMLEIVPNDDPIAPVLKFIPKPFAGVKKILLNVEYTKPGL